MALEPGTAVAPNIRLVRPLGAGGMGSVWIAHHAGLGTEVAVKFIAGELDDHPQARERFAREAQAAARIRDPHIVQIFDHGVMADGTPFLVMELLEGESLQERLEVQGRLSLVEAAAVVGQAAGVLDKAHQMGIVHRDIKPGNLFLTSAGGALFVKLLDFGIAKQHGAHPPNAMTTSSGAILGTPGYMSPEQLLEAKGTDASADRWALAVVAYEMITGGLPFDGETFAAVNLAICTGAFRPATSAVSHIPAALDGFFARAFHIDRLQRFTSAVELAAVFRQACGEPMAAAAPPARRSSTPHRTLISGDTALASSVMEPQSVMSASSTLREERRGRRRWTMAAVVLVGATLAVSAIWGSGAFSGRNETSESSIVPASTPPEIPEPVSAPSVSAAVSAPLSPSAAPSVPPRVVRPPLKWPASTPAPTPTPKPDCTDPFFIDAKGIKRVRRECL